MQIKGKIPLLIVAALAWVVIISSCASQGMPTGGPKDSIPPVLLETNPGFKELNFKGDKVTLTFDEFIVPDQVSEALVISPPLEKRPTVRTKGRSLVVQFNEDLKDSTTYSVDFKNSIADNNEKNPYKNMRISFSTGNVYDSLRIAGRLMNAFNLEAVQNGLVLLQKNLHDSAVYKVRPNYIAKTDDKGIFMIDNLAPGAYHLFAINDASNDLLYNEGSEELAFVDSVFVPSAEFHEMIDTVTKGVDSMLITGHTHFQPDPIYLKQFTEDIFDQYLDSYSRLNRYECVFVFNESVNDTFNLELIENETKDWYQVEYNENVDSLVVWIADTTVARIDTLFMEVSYYLLDSMAELYVQKDTLEMNFVDKVKDESKKKKKKKDDEEEKPKPIPQFNWIANIESTVELNKSIIFKAPQPVNYFDSTQVVLYYSEDTLKKPLNFKFERDTTAWRQYKISYKWQPETEYTIEIDSAACENIYGVTSKYFNKKFKTREEDYYGTVIINAINVSSPLLMQLLQNDDKEAVLVEKTIDKDQIVNFPFISPGKYRIKVIYDDNRNGKWDAGSYQDKYQAERVTYINSVEKVRSNWDSKITWDLEYDHTFVKDIRDRELEEKLRKEAEEKAREERENPQRQEMQNSMFQGGGSGGGGGIIRQ